MRHKTREAVIRRKNRTKAISDFLRQVMPDRALPSPSPRDLSCERLNVVAKTPPPPSPIPSTETPKQGYNDVTEEGEEEEEEEEEEQ